MRWTTGLPLAASRVMVQVFPSAARIVPTVSSVGGSGADPQPPDLQVLDDPERLAAVAALVAHGPASGRVQELTTLAARLLHAPSAQVSLLGATEQVIAARHAPGSAQSDQLGQREQSLCSVTAAFGAPLVVSDAKSHPWVAHLPPVTSGAVGSYLGVILRDANKHVLGSLCVFDPEPRTWTDAQVDVLAILAESVADELTQQSATADDAAALVRLQLAAEAADLGSYDYDLRSGELVWDRRMRSLHGYDETRIVGGIEDYNSVVHPDDLIEVTEQMAQAIATVGELNVEYRVLMPDATVRWINARGRVMPDMLGAAARILGAAYDRSSERGLRDEMTRLLETMPAGFLRCTNDWSITFLNTAVEKILGASRHDLVGAHLWDAFPEARGTAFEVEYHRARDTGVPGMVEAYFDPLDKHFEVHIWPDAAGLSFFLHDVSDRTRAHAALETVSDRLSLLAGAGARLSASLLPAEVLAVLADLVVPDLAALLVLAVVGDVAELLGEPASGDDTQLCPVHLAHADPELQVLLDEVIGASHLTTTASSGVGRAGRTGQSQAMERVPDELLAERATDEEHLAKLQRLNTGASLTLPMRSPLGVLGALSVTAGSGQVLDELLLTDLAGRATVALENALVFARQSRAATDLQRGLLPREAAGVPGIQVATRYLPAVTGALAGGDFFKTVRVEGRLVAVLGDVMGHGSVSAARAGQLHSVIATLALEGHGPGALLGRLGSGIEQIMDLELATLLVCSYDPETRKLTTATAGHPPPLIAPVEGRAFFLEIEPGPPIGVAADPYEEQTCSLEQGATVVLFSDGLVERRGESITVGLERLRKAVNEIRLPPEAVADHVLEELGCTRGGEDDVALLVMSHL